MSIFTIDGNIGCGKSTVLNYLHTHYRMPIDPEPVQKWQPFLEEMYKHNTGAFEFQVRVWLDRCWIQQRPNMATMLMERSPYFQANVFVAANLENGKLTIKEYNMLQEMYAKSMSLWVPAGYIYLRSNPLRCVERIAKRARPCEQTIHPNYIARLHVLHENAYMQAILMGIPVICIDVEGKSIPEIAAEIWNALCIMGMNKMMPASLHAQ